MKRRIVLKNMALVVGGLVLLPACDPSLKKASVPSYLSADQDQLLAEMVDTFIPSTDTPGAKELNIARFVKKVVQDCYEEETQNLLAQGLDRMEHMALQEFDHSFVGASEAQRVSILEKMEQSSEEETKAFFSLVKELSILGYTKSEYVMTQLSDYEMAPGHYHGCVPAKSTHAA